VLPDLKKSLTLSGRENFCSPIMAILFSWILRAIWSSKSL
jgi:hypothetical protein